MCMLSIASTLATLCCVYFVYDTFPRPYNFGVSEVNYDLLPVGRWGVGASFHNDVTHADAEYTYGVIQVRRDFDFTK
jgi:hypothetical protein